MAITRRRFNKLARDFGLTPVRSGRGTPRRWRPTVLTNAPLVGVDGRRNVGVSDAFLARFSEAETVFTLGHEAGHVVMDHWRVRGRHTAHEIQADMWGLLALEAYGYSPHIAEETLSAMRADWPSIDCTGEVTARLAALAFVTKTPATIHAALAFATEHAPAMHPIDNASVWR